MKRNLLLLKSNLLKSLYAISAAFLLLVLLCISITTRAQVVYSLGDQSSTSPVAGDVVNRVNYNGTGVTTITTGPTASLTQPGNIALDGNNNQLFVSELYTAGNVIKVINATTGAVIRSISSANSKYIKDVAYDVANDWLYYITEGGSITVNDAGDAVYRVHADGTGSQTIATSITKNPYRIDVDVAGNKVYVLDVSFSGRNIKTIDLANSNAVTSRSFATSAPAVYDFAIDKVNGYIYYLTEGSNPTTLTATDALRRQNLDGTNDVALITSICNTPFRLALDLGNNRAYIADVYNVTAKIIAVNLSNNTFSTALNLPQGSTAAVLSDLAVPEQPKVTTTAASSITATTATLAGTLVYGYGMSTERGVVYSSTNTTPTVSDTKAANATVTTNAAYSGNVTGLSPATTYYARAYAVNGAGTTYGAVVTFSTLSNDATLSGLSLSSGSLNPTFASATTSYTASVPNSTETISITPTTNQANATLRVNTTIVTSGSASANFFLNIGDNAQHVVVTAQDGSTKTYTVTVNRAKTPQTITFASTASKTYGDADYAPGATASSGLTVSYSSNNAAVATIVSGKIHIVGPGTANITASQAGDASNLAATSVVQALTVNKASITVTANAASKIYGDADPSLTYSVTTGALVGSDAFTGALTRDAGTNIGTYNITQGTLALSTSKYTLSFVTGVLTVNKRAISIQPAPATKSYGDVDPNFPYYFRVGSMPSGDGMAGSYVRDPGETPGTYALSIGTKHPVNATTGVDQSNNYDITYIPEYLTITKRAITLHPVPATKVYGSADPGFPYQFTVGSLAPGEGMTGTFGRPAGEDVGVYALTIGTKRPVNATTGVFTDQYYTISIISDNLTITKKTVNVNANAQSKTFGDADPALTYSADALGFSDTFSGALTRAVGESNGTYAISQGTLALNTTNYNLNFTGSNLTIGKKIINVTADTKSKTYGDTDPALTYTADALANSDTFSGTLTRAAGEASGIYAISQGSLALSNNYTLNYTGSNLTIGKKVINVTANAQSKAYGDADPALTYTADALLAGDAFGGSLTRDAGEFAGSYSINQGSLTLNNNYALNYAGNSLTINKITLSYVATPATKTYLAPNPAFTGTVTGFVNGDTQATATTGTLSFTSTATDSSPQGNYPINGSGLSANNYSFVQSPANGSALTVVLSSDAALSNISVSQGTLNTSFDAATHQYSVNVDHNTTSIDLTAVVHQGNATMLVNGMVLTSGSAITLPLNGGDNYFTTIVTAQDGTTTQSYLVTVNRALSTNTLLTNIALSGVTINPVFDSNTTTYTASVSNLVTGTDITATAADVDANAQIGPFKITATTSYPFSLNVGDNPISVDGVAQNGDIKHYNITVTRAPSSDASLSSLNTTVLSFNEPFSSNTYNYTATVANNVSQFNFVPVGTNNAAVITFNGNPVNYLGVTPTINYGVNTYNIVVTSEDGTATHTYTITVTRTLSSDNNLSTLSIPFVTTVNEPFDAAVLNYTADLADSTITGLPLTAYSYDPNATMKINGTAVARFANYTMTLHGGANTFNIVVTPQDNSTAKTYTLVLTRAGTPPPLLSPNATLSAMSVSATGYSHNFNFAFDVLTPLTVANKVTGVRIHPVIPADGAIATVNGVALAYDASTNLLPLNVGDNTFDVVVTAADGVHQTTNTLHINRLPFADISLASLAIDAGTLSPAFVGTTLTYSASVPYSVSNLNVTPVANAADATVTIGAATINAGAPSASVPLNVGLPNRIRVTVTAADGVNTQNYTVNVTRLAPDATLASLTLGSGTLSPAFNSTTTTYTASVGSNVGSVLITPTATDPGAVITINGTLIGASATVPLIAGDNSFGIVVTAGGTVTQTYNVTITKAATSSDATLASLNLSDGTLSPLFDAGTTAYTATVSNATGTLTLSPFANDINAAVLVNGNGLDVSGTIDIPLTVGANAITIIVKSQDSTSTKTYSLVVTRAERVASSRITLSSITTTPSTTLTVTAASATAINYSTSVSPGTNSIVIVPKAQDGTSTITIEGVVVSSGSASAPIPLNPTGSTAIHIVITASDGVTNRIYTLLVNRNGSSSATLNSLTTTPSTTLTVTTGTSSVNYKTSVAPGTSSIVITPKAVNASASITIDGNTVVSGSASTPIPLNVAGSTTIHIVVTAEDGVTIRTYSLLVNQNGSSDAVLTSIATNPSTTLVLTTGASLVNYQTSVAVGTNDIIVTPTAKDPRAVITVNGVTVNSGSGSAPITLNTTGSTIINIVVRAQDGTTTRSYSILVNKNGSSSATLNSITTTPSTTLTVLNAGSGQVNYETSVAASTNSIRITPKAIDANAVITIEGVVVSSGATCAPISLNTTGSTIIHIRVAAQDGVTVRTYSILVNKNGSSSASLNALTTTPSTTLMVTTGTSSVNYKTSVPAGTGSITVTPKAVDTSAMIIVEGRHVVSGTASTPILLNDTGATIIHITVKAQDSVAIRTYSILVNKSFIALSSISNGDNDLVGVATKSNNINVNGITVHQALSPNGDGVNDVFTIDGIGNYADNHLSIMNAGGLLVYDVQSYGSNGNVFDGHSNKNGTMQKPGTYYYSLEYKDGNETKRKTGYIILKY